MNFTILLYPISLGIFCCDLTCFKKYFPVFSLMTQFSVSMYLYNSQGCYCCWFLVLFHCVKKKYMIIIVFNISESERETELSSSGSLPKCLHQLGLGLAKAASLESNWSLWNPITWAIILVAPRVCVRRKLEFELRPGLEPRHSNMTSQSEILTSKPVSGIFFFYLLTHTLLLVFFFICWNLFCTMIYSYRMLSDDKKNICCAAVVWSLLLMSASSIWSTV